MLKIQTKKQKEAEINYRRKVLEQRLGRKIFDKNYKYGNTNFYISDWILPQLVNIKEILNEIAIEKLNSKIVLELGAESGHASSFICNNFKTKLTIASDIANSLNEAVPFVASQLGFNKYQRLVILDNYRLPFKDNSVDFVFGVSVLHHVPDPYFILKEVKRVLSENGIVLFLKEPFLPRYFLPLQFLYSRFDKRQGICESVFSLKKWFSFMRDFKIMKIQLELPELFKKILPNTHFICRYLTGGGLNLILKRK